jgi:hypothetical protein
MKQKFFLFAVIAFVAIALNVTLFQAAGAAAPPEEKSRQAAPENSARVDIAINDRGDVSVGGVALSALGLQPVDAQLVNAIKTLGDVELTAQNEMITVTVPQGELGRVLWSPASRQVAANLAADYGIVLAPATYERIEDWISTTNIDLTARHSNEASHPAEVMLSTPIQVQVAPNGQLTVEGGPLATGIDPMVLQTMQMGGNSAVACWNQGTLTAMVDGEELPSIVLNPEGAAMLAKALNLPINDVGLNAILNSRLGIDLSLPGGSPMNGISCAN